MITIIDSEKAVISPPLKSTYHIDSFYWMWLFTLLVCSRWRLRYWNGVQNFNILVSCYCLLVSTRGPRARVIRLQPHLKSLIWTNHQCSLTSWITIESYREWITTDISIVSSTCFCYLLSSIHEPRVLVGKLPAQALNFIFNK